MKVLAPLDVAAGRLVSSSVPFDDYPLWSAGMSYGIGARVIRAGQVSIYESVTDANSGNDPAIDAANWLAIGTANRWAMFDNALGSATMATGSIVVVLETFGAVDTLAVLDTNAPSVRVRLIDGATTLYDLTQAPMGSMPLIFSELPTHPTARITLTIAVAAGPVDVGTVITGLLAELGLTEKGPTIGITDFSRRETDDFGVTTIIERGWAKRMTARAMLPSTEVDAVQARLAALRGRPSLWIAEDGYDALTILGFYKDFSIDLVAGSVSYCSLTIEGLTEAPQLLPPEIANATYSDGTPIDNLRPAEPGATVGATPAQLAQIALAQQRIDDIESLLGDGTLDISALMDRLQAAEDGLYSVQTTLGGQAGSISSMQTVIEGQAGTLAQLQTDVSAANSGVSSVSTALDLLDTQYASLSNTVSTQGVTISDQATSLTQITGNVTQLFGQRFLTIDVQGRVSGLYHMATDSYSSLEFASDLVTFRSPSGAGPRSEYVDGVWRVYGGATMLAFGRPFGSANQFLRWSGPTQASLSDCTEANAIDYNKTNGDAYFGGALLAGALRNGNTSSSTSTTAATSTGTFGSNGGPISVIGSWSYTSTFTNSYPANITGRNAYDAAISGFGAAVTGDGVGEPHIGSKPDNRSGSDITLYVRKAGTIIATQAGANGSVTIEGWRPVLGDSPGSIRWTYNYSGSVTVADPETSTLDRTFSADIVRGWTPGGTGSQRLSILSVEY